MDNSITQLRSVTCHMGSHSVTCYPIQVNTPHLNPSHTGRYSIYLPRRDGRLSWPRWLVTYLDGLPACRRSPIQCTNRAQCRLTSLIKPTLLTTTLRRHPKEGNSNTLGSKSERNLQIQMSHRNLPQTDPCCYDNNMGKEEIRTPSGAKANEIPKSKWVAEIYPRLTLVATITEIWT